MDKSAASQPTLNISSETEGAGVNGAPNSDCVDFSRPWFVLIRKGMTHHPAQAVRPLLSRSHSSEENGDLRNGETKVSMRRSIHEGQTAYTSCVQEEQACFHLNVFLWSTYIHFHCPVNICIVINEFQWLN